MQAGELVREPRNAVRLAAPGGMLDEIIPARTFTPRRLHQLPNRVKLMEARKNHRFLRYETLSAATVIHFFLLFFEEHEVAENIEETFELKHALPEVTCAVAGFVLWIARAADDLARMAAAVERGGMR